MTDSKGTLPKITDLLKAAQSERDFWKRRYKVQHKTVHALGDRVKELEAEIEGCKTIQRLRREGSTGLAGACEGPMPRPSPRDLERD